MENPVILWTDEDIYAVSLFVYNENDNPCKPTMTLGYNTEMQVKEIHQSGVLTQKFKKELPIIIHELEYYDEIAEQNIEANGRILLADFIDFCNC